MFFPRLKTNERTSVRMTAEELRQLYDLVVRPAAADTMPDIVHDWPGSFSTAEWKDRNARSGFSHTSYVIPQDRLRAFSREIRQLVNTHPRLMWARNFFWGVEIRGVKDMCSHSINAPEAEKNRLIDLVLHQVDTTEGTWYADIGIQCILQDQALLWATNGHKKLLSHLLGITPAEANSFISNPRCYTRDITTHIMSLSGFRADFSQGFGAGPLFAVYAQAYQTDKQQTYHPEGSRFGKTLTGKVAVQGSPPPWCQSLLRVYSDAAPVVDVATRFEVRIPLEFIGNALTHVDQRLLKTTMVCYKRELWW